MIIINTYLDEEVFACDTSSTYSEYQVCKSIIVRTPNPFEACNYIIANLQVWKWLEVQFKMTNLRTCWRQVGLKELARIAFHSKVLLKGIAFRSLEMFVLLSLNEKNIIY